MRSLACAGTRVCAFECVCVDSNPHLLIYATAWCLCVGGRDDGAMKCSDRACLRRLRRAKISVVGCSCGIVLHVEMGWKVRGRDSKHAEFHCSEREMERGMDGGRGDTCRRTEGNVCEGEEGIRLGPS